MSKSTVHESLVQQKLGSMQNEWGHIHCDHATLIITDADSECSSIVVCSNKKILNVHMYVCNWVSQHSPLFIHSLSSCQAEGCLNPNTVVRKGSGSDYRFIPVKHIRIQYCSQCSGGSDSRGWRLRSGIVGEMPTSMRDTNGEMCQFHTYLILLAYSSNVCTQ